MVIKKISEVETSKIWDSYNLSTCKYEYEEGLYYLIDDGKYVGIDNSTNDAWTEEFNTLEECKNWLEGAELESDKWERTCSHCNKKMDEGYCIHGGVQYFCSQECLEYEYTQEEWLELYDDGNSDSYYTTWEDDE